MAANKRIAFEKSYTENLTEEEIKKSIKNLSESHKLHIENEIKKTEG
jgi:hypothetical protein